MLREAGGAHGRLARPRWLGGTETLTLNSMGAWSHTDPTAGGAHPYGAAPPAPPALAGVAWAEAPPGSPSPPGLCVYSLDRIRNTVPLIRNRAYIAFTILGAVLCKAVYVTPWAGCHAWLPGLCFAYKA